MKQLTFEEVRPLVHGAIEMHEENGTLALERYTAATRAYYEQAKPEYMGKTHATAGMRLEFDTDATEVRFSFETRFGSSRRYCTFDVTVDGALLATPAHNDADGTVFSFSVTRYLDGNSHRVRVYLPNLWIARIVSVAVSDGATVTPVVRPHRLFCVGDSITQGYDAYRPSQSYVNILADDLDADVVNQAIGGDVFRPDALDPALPFSPHVITVAYGTNDWSKRPREEIERDAPAYYARMREIFPKAILFAVTPLWREGYDVPKPSGLVLADVAAIVRKAGEAVGAHVIDGMPLVPNMIEYFYDRRLHPNDAGFAHYARNLLRAMRPYL